ncbi:MauE/DoxX family redox-associated membrane protein [Sinomicrobium sp. M5D2P17]
MKRIVSTLNYIVQKNRHTIIEIICYLFVILFVYASVSKFVDHETFKAQLGQSPMLTAFAAWIAWIVPISELLISILLTIPRFRLIALYASYTLMVLFTTYIITVLNFSYHVPCSCGGVLEKMGWTEHIFFNMAFIILAVIGIILLTRKETPKQETSNELIPAT